MSKLTVCPKCGWHYMVGHERYCDPKAGAVADRLAALLKEIPSTKLGYGDGSLTFLFDDDHSLTLRIDRGAFSVVEHFFWNDRLADDAVVKLVRALSSALSQ